MSKLNPAPSTVKRADLRAATTGLPSRPGTRRNIVGTAR